MATRHPGKPPTAPPIWRLLACLLPAAWSCANEPQTIGAGQSTGQSVGPVVHNAFGMPGPWWQAEGSAQGFEADLSRCRHASSQARNRAGEPDPLDAAYRAFLGCMDTQGWQRGLPPPPTDD